MSIPINKLTAESTMNSDVLMAFKNWTINRLSSFFIENGISGVPVIASDQSLVGVVTVTDILNFDTKTNKEGISLVEEVYAEFAGFKSGKGIINKMVSKANEQCSIKQVTTSNAIQVEEDAPLTQVSKIMLDAGIHRIFVSKDGLLSGVISTTNILRVISQL